MSEDPSGRLFEPVACRGKTLPSRIVLAAINTGFSRSHEPTTRLVRFHRERSGAEIGVSFVGNVAISRAFVTNDRTAVLEQGSRLRRYAVLVRSIRTAGSVAGIQLAGAPEDLSPQRRWVSRDPAGELARLRGMVASLSDKKIANFLDGFVTSAALAIDAGFEMVQIHAAHGYFLSLLLCPATNQRTGSFAASGLWFDEFLTRLRRSVGENLLGVRVSALIGITHASEEIEWAKETARRATKADVDVVDLSAGFYTINKNLIYPPESQPGPTYWEWIDDFARISRIVTIAGNMRGLINTRYLPGNCLVALGRPLIADPKFAEKAKNGEWESICQCNFSNSCHYFSRGRKWIECSVNKDI